MEARYMLVKALSVLFLVLAAYNIYCIIGLKLFKRAIKRGKNIEDIKSYLNIFVAILKAKHKKHANKSAIKIKVKILTKILLIVSIIFFILGCILTIVSKAMYTMVIAERAVVAVASIGNTDDDKDKEVNTDYNTNDWIYKTNYVDESRFKENEYPSYTNYNGSKAGVFGRATGKYAKEYHDGSFYWYHQTCEPVHLSNACENCGDWSEATWGRTGTSASFGQVGCAMYSLAMGLSAEAGRAITPDVLLGEILGLKYTIVNGVKHWDLSSNTYNGQEFFAETCSIYWSPVVNRINQYFKETGETVRIRNIQLTQANLDTALSSGSVVWAYFCAGTAWYNGAGNQHFMTIRSKDAKGYYVLDSCTIPGKDEYGNFNDIAEPSFSKIYSHILNLDAVYEIYNEYDYMVDLSNCPWRIGYSYEGLQCLNIPSADGAPQGILFAHYFNGLNTWVKNPSGNIVKSWSSYISTKKASYFDNEGYAMIEGRKCVAVTNLKDGGIAQVGDKLDVYMDNDLDGIADEIMYCIVGDIKSSNDYTWTPYGHLSTEGLTDFEGLSGEAKRLKLLQSKRVSVIEFIVDGEKWYNNNGAVCNYNYAATTKLFSKPYDERPNIISIRVVGNVKDSGDADLSRINTITYTGNTLRTLKY